MEGKRPKLDNHEPSQVDMPDEIEPALFMMCGVRV